MNRDLTVGSPRNVIWRFCLPLFFSTLFQQLYVVTDSLVAGRFIGEAALAAVGNTYHITLIYQALAFGCTMGCSVVVSRLFGTGKKNAVRSAVSTAFIACLALCAVLTAAGLLGGDALLRLLQTPDDVIRDSGVYLNIYTIGLCFLFYYQVSLGIFIALGDAKTPFWFLTVSSLVNIVLDFLFVGRLNMGVAGVAWATFICQAAGAAAASALALRKRSLLKTAAQDERRERVFSAELLREMLKIAAPVALQQLIISVGNVLVQGNVNRFGSSVSAGYAAAVKMNNMALTAMIALDRGMASYAAQNAGAKKPERIRSGLKAGLLLSATIGCLIGAAYLIFRENIIMLFLKTNGGEALATGTQFLLIVVPFYLVVSVKIVCDGLLRGLGAMRLLVTGTFVDLTLRVTVGFLLASFFGPVGIWAAWPVGWITGTSLSAFFVSRLLRTNSPRLSAGG